MQLSHSPGRLLLRPRLLMIGGGALLMCATGARAATCDVNGDGLINAIDISTIMAARNTAASGAGDPRDADGDGRITVLDARICSLRSTQAGMSDPATACANIVNMTTFPVMPTQITLAKFNPAGTTTSGGVSLPDHCQVQGIVNKRTGTDGFPYGDSFEVRLPAPTQWNSRFMFQGGGGTEGSVPAATGTAGSASPTLAKGYVVATQDGGHENSQLPVANQFFLDPQAVADHAYRSVDVTTQTAKYLINAYYGQPATHSYFVGCSTGGRQGMMLSQNFPTYFDGIVAGDPVFDLESISLSEVYGVEATKAISPLGPNGLPQYYLSIPVADQNLFTSALLASCDALDGLADGVIDNLAACQASFDPATFVFPSTGQPLQCAGAKTATCLSPAQVGAIKKINQGPRNSLGQTITDPAGGLVASGYAYDGGFMSPAGIPSRKIGTATSVPGDLSLGLGQIPYTWLNPPDVTFDPTLFNFDTDVARLNPSSPLVSYSTSTNISTYVARGGKMIFYHGLSDPGPPVTNTINYYNKLATLNGGLTGLQTFAKLYLVPNMGHCSGGPSTDQFDMLTPLVNWVESGVAPDAITASGSAFTVAPAARSRPLCVYPKTAKYIGGDASQASSYSCQSASGKQERGEFLNP